MIKSASAKGLVAGNLDILMDDGLIISCHQSKNVISKYFFLFLKFLKSWFCFQGVLVPTYVNKIIDVQTNCRFILIIEKDATFQRLIDDNFLIKYPGILITVKY